MRRWAYVGLCLLVSLAVLPAIGATPASATPPPDFEVSGTGVGMYPDFDPAVVRYAVTTTVDTAGSVTVTVPAGSTVDGVAASGADPCDRSVRG